MSGERAARTFRLSSVAVTSSLLSYTTGLGGRFRVSNRRDAIVASATVAAFLVLWNARVVGNFSWIALFVLAAYAAVCMSYGHAFFLLTRRLLPYRPGWVFRFLCGYFCFNTLLYAIVLASPLGMVADVLIVSIVGVAGAVFLDRRMREADDVAPSTTRLPDLLCLVISGAAATLWCLDAQGPLLIDGDNAVFQVWYDVFIHTREISVFGQSHGIGSIHDIKVAGAPAQIYHFASYISTAALYKLTGTSAIQAYSSVHVPFGIFLTGLGAFALAESIWGGSAALAACAAILLVPDAFQHGFQNRYLSYNFLAQVNPGMLYGIACGALAWLFVIAGSAKGRYAAIFIGYCLAVVCLLYKAHVFVAIAYLILIYPCLFFDRLGARRRLAIGLAFTAIFVLAVVLSQRFGRVPVLRLDGSGFSSYLLQLLSDFDRGGIKGFFSDVFLHRKYPRAIQALFAIAMLLIGTFGLWIVATATALLKLRGRMEPAIFYFPVLIIANYLIMSMGLALDTREVGTPDELLNRPLVWAYFIVVIWTVGAAWQLASENRQVIGPRIGKRVTIAFAAFVAIGLLGVAIGSRDFQTFPTRGGYASYREFNSIPRCIVAAANFLREHSDAADVIQDSANDPRFAFTALSERQAYFIDGDWGGVTFDFELRKTEMKNFLQFDDAARIEKFAKDTNLAWVLLRPESKSAWPASFLDRPAFSCGGYRLFRLAA